MRRLALGPLVGLWIWLAVVVPVRAGAQPQPSVEVHALVVGSNAGGPGQQTLRFAERDAERVAGLLVELGRTAPDAVRLLVAPDRATLMAALGQTAERLRSAQAAGRKTQLVFFYSGHARADALNLGDQRLPLSELRATLSQMPATLRVVLLDACQSGAFSGIKGATPAADFSYNATAQLQTSGLAVVSSSTGAELSQESEELGSGYFTHHLLVALRGAADGDSDGRVSLRETYDYVYRHTLADTSRTRVGGQHVALEQRLSGKGDVALSFPDDAAAHLVLPEALSGQVLVQLQGGGAVLAELYKRRGERLRVALPVGRYSVVVRADEEVVQCERSLSRGDAVTLSLGGCERVRAPETLAKGAPPSDSVETWFVEAGLQALRSYDDAYVNRLGVFGFDDDAWFTPPGLRLTLGRQLTTYLGIGIGYATLELREFARAQIGDNPFQTREWFEWHTHALLLQPRLRVASARETWQGYLQLGGGIGVAFTEFRDHRDDSPNRTPEMHHGPVFEAALGVGWNPVDHFGMFAQLAHTHAPLIENEIGDTRDSGGTSLTFGLRGRLMTNTQGATR